MKLQQMKKENDRINLKCNGVVCKIHQYVEVNESPDDTYWKIVWQCRKCGKQLIRKK